MQVDIVRREVGFTGGDEAVPGEVDEDAVVAFGDGRKPDFELVANVGDGGFFVDELVDVLGGELSAFGADERRVDVFGVAVGVLELRGGREVFVGRDADDESVAAWDGDGRIFCAGADRFEIARVGLLLLGCEWKREERGEGEERSPGVEFHTVPSGAKAPSDWVSGWTG